MSYIVGKVINSVITVAVIVVSGMTYAGELYLRDGEMLVGEVTLRRGGVYYSGKVNKGQLYGWDSIRRVRLRDVVNTYVLASDEKLKPMVYIRHGIMPELATNDAINGIVGELITRDGKERKQAQWLSDARTFSEPVEDKWFSGEVIWDLGDKIPASERRLDEVSIWIRSDDKARCDYSGSLEVSESGNVFVPIDGTYTNISFYEWFGTGFRGTLNNVRYIFPPGMVTGFRFLKWNVNPSPWSNCESRFIEVDVFVSRVAAQANRPSVVILTNGIVVCGQIKKLSKDGLEIGADKNKYSIPMMSVSRIYFKTIIDKGDKTVDLRRNGLLLVNRDFIEGELYDIDGDTLILSSVMFGLRKFSMKLGISAIIMKEEKKADMPIKVMSKGGSVYYTGAFDLSGEVMEFNAGLLGGIKLAISEIAELEILKEVFEVPVVSSAESSFGK